MDLVKFEVQTDKLLRPFTIFASQPITPKKFKKEDIEFTEVSCKKATEEQQGKLKHYLNRAIEIMTKH